MGTPTRRLADIATVIRSKNAGPFEITFEIMFDDPAGYRAVKRSGVLTPQLVSRLYGVPAEDVLACVPYDPALTFKITLRRPVGSGDARDTDVYGCQQHVPLMDVRIPVAPSP